MQRREVNPGDPPKVFLQFFRWYCHPKLVSSIEGDLRELYGERRKESGKRAADIRFFVDVMLLFRPGIIRPAKGYVPINNYAMLINYFKTGWRNLVKNKGYSSINIAGLAVGMAVATLIGLWIHDEVTFNRSFTHHQRIARVMVKGVNSSGLFVQWATAPPMASEIRNLYGSEFKHVMMSSRPVQEILSAGPNKVSKTGYYIEAGVADMLSLTRVAGDLSTTNKEGILLSASAAKALFGDRDPVNQLVRIDDHQDVTVTGVYEDLPENTDFNDMAFIATWDLYVSNSPWLRKDDWRQNGFATFAEIADHTNMQAASAKIKDIRMNHATPEDAVFKFEVFLHPMDQWRLYSDLEQGGGRITFVWLYGCIGLFVLLLACINFMNLSTARSEKRAREVGIRKSMGSFRRQLVGQFFSESLLVTLLAFALSIVLVQLSLPFFNIVADKKIAMPWTYAYFWIGAFAFVLFTGLVSGSYPALYLSSFQPIKVLKGTFKVGRLATIPRKVLVVVQFTVSVVLIVGVIVVFRQIQHGKQRPVGYQREGLVAVKTPTPSIHEHIDAVRHELKQSGLIGEVAESVNSVTTINGVYNGFDWTGNGPDIQSGFPTTWASHELGKTVGWEFLAGRDFSREHASDTAAIILNETAVHYMNLKDPIGKTIKWTIFDKTKTFTVIGVIRDMLMESPFYPVRKSIYMIETGRGNILNVRINPNVRIQDALSEIEQVFKKYSPEVPFEYSFVDQDYARKFSEEESIGTLASIFATLAVFISCLGIFGLASFVAEQRTKEIGIRKVLGASVTSVWRMLSKEFVLLVVLACALAVPISWYFLDGWLQQYDYKTDLSWWIFAITGAGALAITLMTVSFQSVKAALANPVKSLRSE